MSGIGATADPTRGHARRKGPRGRWELLVDDTWVPEEHVQAWEAAQRLGSQAAAARELGIPKATLHSRIGAYMSALGMSGPRPAAPGAGRAGGRKPLHTRVVEPPPPSVSDGPQPSDPVPPTAGSEGPPAAGRADTAAADPTAPMAAPDRPDDTLRAYWRLKGRLRLAMVVLETIERLADDSLAGDERRLQGLCAWAIERLGDER